MSLSHTSPPLPLSDKLIASQGVSSLPRFVYGLIKALSLAGYGLFFFRPKQGKGTEWEQHHRQQPGHHHGGTNRGAQYAQFHPDPRGGDDKRERGRLQEPGR